MACIVRTIFAVALTVLAWNLGGCAAAASVGTDVGGTLAEKSVELFSLGKTASYQPVKIDDAIACTRNAARELNLKLVKEEKHPDQLKLVYVDDRKQKITITVVRRTATMTELHTDVGLFGVTGVGRLVMREILRDLPGTTEEDRKSME